ncbi:MAG: hypothetical protein ABSB15_05290 [Bryobacteraceae bacterium]
MTRIKTECEKTAEAVEKTIGPYTEHLMKGALKGAVLADVIRLLQMEEEMDMNQPARITIGWAARKKTRRKDE